MEWSRATPTILAPSSPFTLWLTKDAARPDPRLRLALLFGWVGFGATMVRLYRNRTGPDR